MKSTTSIYGEVTNIIAEPDGNNSVIVQLGSVRRRESDLELVQAAPTQEELAAPNARHATAFKEWESNPSDPNRVQELRATLRELGWLKDLPS